MKMLKIELFGKRLREVRLELSLSQAELAKRTGLHPAAISHFETNSRLPSLKNLCVICEALNRMPRAFLTEASHD